MSTPTDRKAAGRTPPTAETLRRRSREALAALAVQFLLGMAVNLIGIPSGVFAYVVDGILLGLHILVGIGIIVVGIRLQIVAGRIGLGERQALWGMISVSVAFLAGVATFTGIEWFSYLMAVGFLAASGFYVATYVLGVKGALTTPAAPSSPGGAA